MGKPESLKDTVDQCPYEFYDEIRSTSELWWDQASGSWLASSYEAVRELYSDEERFARPDPGEIAQGKYWRILGPGHTTSVRGQERAALRKWWLNLFRKPAIEAWRSGVAAEIIESTIDSFASQGRAELVEDYTNLIPFQMISALLGLPWRDREWMARRGGSRWNPGRYLRDRRDPCPGCRGRQGGSLRWRAEQDMA
jgi:cytochrome P450